MPRLLDDRLPGIREKRAEIDGWVKLARAQDWYRPDDEVDAALPFLNRDLGWEDKNWGANEHSFSLLLDRYVRPGMRVLEVGAAKCWGAQHLVPRGCAYVGVDILDDPVIGLGRGAFYAERVGPFERVQADGEHLPFRDATLRPHVLRRDAAPRARPRRDGARDGARDAAAAALVCALNEGTRAPRASGDNAEQSEEQRLGINEHVHTLWAYLWSFGRAGLVVRRVEQAEGYGELATRNIAGKLLRLPGGKAWSMLWAQNVYGYGGVSIYARKPGRDAVTAVYADLYRYRELFRNLFRRDLRAKYKGSVLGVAWTLAYPLLLMGDLPARLLACSGDGSTSRTTRCSCSPGSSSGCSSRRRCRTRLAVDARQREPHPQGALPAPARAVLGRRARSSSPSA